MPVLEVALFAAPYLLLIATFLLGRFPGERAILARRVAPSRRTAQRWRPAVESALASLRERTSHRLRGPPAAASI